MSMKRIFNGRIKEIITSDNSLQIPTSNFDFHQAYYFCILLLQNKASYIEQTDFLSVAKTLSCPD